MSDKGGAAAVADAGANAAAGNAASTASSDVSLLDPSNDQTKTGGNGGSDPNAQAKAGDAAKAGAKDDAASKTGDAKDGQAKGAPEKYETFKVPEGVSLDPELVTEFSAVAKALNLSQADAQKLVDLQTKVGQKTVEQGLKTFSDMKKGWEAEIAKELGASFQAERAMAAKGRDKFATPEMVKLLNDSGLGSHPEVFKLFAKLGRAVAEDSFHEGKSAGAGAEPPPKPTAEVLFGRTTPPKK